MADSDTRYNGWTNYPTWAVNMWLSNDEGLYNMVRERATELLADAEPTEIQTAEQSAAYDLARWLSDELCEAGGDYGLVPELEGFPSDLLGYALGLVDWDDIASTWFHDAREG